MKTEIAVINVELKDAPYKIERKIKVPTYITLAQLHLVLQIVFEWENIHLYKFKINGKSYSSPDDEYANADASNMTKNVRLSDILLQEQFVYVYDFGDNWIHIITIEKLEQVDEEDFIPICISAIGEPSFEDIGGVGGFEDLLNIANKEKLTKEDKEYIKWTGLSAQEIRKLPTHPIYIEDINDCIKCHWKNIKAGKDI
jgi:hypothetical protein